MSETKTIDFRRTYWGHNIDLRPNGKNRFKGGCHSTPRPARGDRILWKTEYGHAVAEVLDVEYCMDPMDMCFIDCKVVDRVMEAKQ